MSTMTDWDTRQGWIDCRRYLGGSEPGAILVCFLELAEEKSVEGEFQEAIYNFNKAMTLKPDYLPLDGSVRRLQQILNKQSQPVEIVFISDGATWVSISGYKMLGKFKGEYTEKFLPGNYRIVGRRKGYHDILFEVRVRSGQQLPVINVVCNERI